MPFPRGTNRVGAFVWGSWRAERGWSLADLATRSGVNRGDLSRYERGRLSVPAAVFEKVMQAFGVRDAHGDVANPGTVAEVSSAPPTADPERAPTA